MNIEEHIQIRQEEKRQRINRRHRLEEGRGTQPAPKTPFLGKVSWSLPVGFIKPEESCDRESNRLWESDRVGVEANKPSDAHPSLFFEGFNNTDAQLAWVLCLGDCPSPVSESFF